MSGKRIITFLRVLEYRSWKDQAVDHSKCRVEATEELSKGKRKETLLYSLYKRHMSLLSQLTNLYWTIIIEDDGLPIHFADVNGYS